MDNWLLIIVGTIFLICIAFGYVRGFLKLGLSLLSTILTLVLVLFLSPHVTRALKEYTPVDDFLESKVTEKFMPEITSEQLQSIDLTGTPLENLTAEDISKLNEMDWDVLGITADDILSVIAFRKSLKQNNFRWKFRLGIQLSEHIEHCLIFLIPIQAAKISRPLTVIDPYIFSHFHAKYIFHMVEIRAPDQNFTFCDP